MLFTPPPATTFHADKVIEPVNDRNRKFSRKSKPLSRRLSTTALSSNDSSSNSRRQLRLRASDKGLQFRTELVTQRAKERVADFLDALNGLPRELQEQVNRLREDLERFGYQLKAIYNPKHSEKSVFNDWELGYSLLS